MIHSDLEVETQVLPALPTRDAVIVLLALLRLVKREGRPLSEIAAGLPQRFTASDRLQDFPTEHSQAILARFSTGDPAADRAALDQLFAADFGPARQIDRTDGVRVTLASGEILHLRPSGNAPEFRCYTEAASDLRAREMNARILEILRAIG
jgi:phosphomannomutase